MLKDRPEYFAFQIDGMKKPRFFAFDESIFLSKDDDITYMMDYYITGHNKQILD